MKYSNTFKSKMVRRMTGPDASAPPPWLQTAASLRRRWTLFRRTSQVCTFAGHPYRVLGHVGDYGVVAVPLASQGEALSGPVVLAQHGLRGDPCAGCRSGWYPSRPQHEQGPVPIWAFVVSCAGSPPSGHATGRQGGSRARSGVKSLKTKELRIGWHLTRGIRRYNILSCCNGLSIDTLIRKEMPWRAN